MRDRYGRTRFGQCCLMARRLIEAGVRFVTVNMFETVFDEITWDIHGSKPFTDIQQMAKLVAPNFDQAYSTLLEELERARPAVEHDGPGDGRVRPHAEDQPGRRPRSSSRRLDDPHGRRPDPGRPGHRRVGRTGLRPEEPAGDTGRGGGDRLPRPGPRPAQGPAGPQGRPIPLAEYSCSRSRNCSNAPRRRPRSATTEKAAKRRR